MSELGKHTFLRFLMWLSLAVFITDSAASFLQHYHMPLDGDMAVTILPAPGYSVVLTDPFGLKAAIDKEVYIHPNRYFLMQGRMTYFKTVPQFLQHFVEPIPSVYLACAIFKIIMQMSIIVLLSSYLGLALGISRKYWIVLMAGIAPFFQALGYYESMGIIDWSITYAFSYSTSIVFLLLYFLPFYKSWITDKPIDLKTWQKILYLISIPILPLSGSLISGVVLILGLLIFIFYIIRSIKPGSSDTNFIARITSDIPRPYFYFLLPLGLMCVYSVYIGQFNAENLTHTLPVNERYNRLPQGIEKIFSRTPALTYLCVFCLINVILINTLKLPSRKKINTLLLWVFAFMVIYILLLPLGGFRIYRKFIVRYDSFIPISLCLIFFFALGTGHIILKLKKYRWIYIPFVLGFLIHYANKDRLQLDRDACEREALYTIATSSENPVELDIPCNVMTWTRRTNAAANGYNSRMLVIWNITDTKKGYYQKTK